MEEFQEADVLWPEQTPPPSHGEGEEHNLPVPELYDATTVFSCESFSDQPAASSSSTSSAVLFGRSDDSLSDLSTTAGHGEVAEEFQEAGVIWPDVDTAGQIEREDGGGFWWLCCGLGEAGRRRVESAAAVKREAWTTTTTLVSSPIDIPTGDQAGRRQPTAVLVHRR